MLDYPPNEDFGNIKVAFYGPMCSGKTYAAATLFPVVQKFGLAQPLKDTAREYFNVTGKTNHERQILQELADDIKKWDNDVFTKRLLWTVYNYERSYQKEPIVIDDLRFPHEARDLSLYGFIIVRVYIPEDIRLVRVAEKYPDTDASRHEHRSEKGWKDIKPDFTISGFGDKGIANLREALLNRA